MKAALLSWLVVGLALLMGVPQRAEGFVNSNNSITNGVKPRNVCVLYYTAIAECDPSKPPSTYTGYEVELIRKMAAWMVQQGQSEWTPDNYTFTCLVDFGLGLADMLKPSSASVLNCDILLGGLHTSSIAQTDGYRLSAPTFTGGQAIMIYVPASTDIFAFLKPFSAAVWLVVFATSVFVGVVVTLMEVPLRRVARNPSATVRKFMNLQWASTGMLLQAMQQFNARTVGARLTILGYAFVILIIINSYIAVLSSQLTVNSINLNINSVSDLLTKRVGVFELDAPRWKAMYNLQLVTPLPWSTQQDEEDMVTKLTTRQIDAIILDQPWVDYRVATTCELYTVGDSLMPFSMGFIFEPTTGFDYLNLWNKGMYSMQETGVTASLESTYIKPTAACPGKNGANLADAQITLKQIAGLWVFLAGALGLGLLCNFVTWLWERIRQNRVDDEGATSMNDVSGHGQVSMSGASSTSLKGRSMSFAKNNPDLAWASVAHASTSEEAMELLEGLIQQMDRRMKTNHSSLEGKLANLTDALARSGVQVHNGKGDDFAESFADRGLLPSKSSTVSFHVPKAGAVPPVSTHHEPIVPFTPPAELPSKQLTPEPPSGPRPAKASPREQQDLEGMASQDV